MNPPIPPQRPPAGSTPVEMSLSQAERVASATEWAEAHYRNRAIPDDRSPRGGASNLIPAFVTTQVTAGSLASGTLTYGSGVVTFAVDGGTSLTAGTTTGVTVKNVHDKKIAVNALVWLTMFNNKWHVVDVWSCSALS